MKCFNILNWFKNQVYHIIIMLYTITPTMNDEEHCYLVVGTEYICLSYIYA